MLKQIMNELVGDKRTIGLEGGDWKRIVVIVDKNDSIEVTNPDGDPGKVLLVIKKGAMNPNVRQA